MFNINFSTQRQCVIANLLWACNTKKDVNALIEILGTEAEVVFQMILTATIDQETETQTEFPFVMELLESLK